MSGMVAALLLFALTGCCVRGDVIVATVGEEASYVTIGKDINIAAGRPSGTAPGETRP